MSHPLQLYRGAIINQPVRMIEEALAYWGQDAAGAANGLTLEFIINQLKGLRRFSETGEAYLSVLNQTSAAASHYPDMDIGWGEKRVDGRPGRAVTLKLHGALNGDKYLELARVDTNNSAKGQGWGRAVLEELAAPIAAQGNMPIEVCAQTDGVIVWYLLGAQPDDYFVDRAVLSLKSLNADPALIAAVASGDTAYVRAQPMRVRRLVGGALGQWSGAWSVQQVQQMALAAPKPVPPQKTAAPMLQASQQQLG